MRTILAIILLTLSSCSEPEVELGPDETYLVKSVSERDPSTPVMYDDPDYVANRLTELALLYADRITAEEIDALYAGEITSQEALDLTDEEHDALYLELQALAEASERFAADDQEILKQRNDGKGPRGKDNQSGCDAQADDCSFKATLGAGLAGARYGPWVFVGVAIAGHALCLCAHCKGYSTIKKACEVVKQ